MVRYRRYRRYARRRNSTNVIKMKFQSFMDISTSDSSMQIITISAGGKDLLRRLAPQFGAYKYYKIGNIAVKLVPASTLPVDPSGLSYEAGENQVDPRDQLTPGMMRITNGEDIFEDITGLSDTQQHGIYNNMLLDPRWFKWMLQSGVKRHATPRYWIIGQLHQDKWPGAIVNYPQINSDGDVTGTTSFAHGYKKDDVSPANVTRGMVDTSSPYGFFQTGHTGRLGWLPTDSLQAVPQSAGDALINKPLLASPVEVEVMKLILPKAFATRYYYRMFITETVYFKEPIVNFGINAYEDTSYRPLDVFHDVGQPQPRFPSTGIDSAWPYDGYTGGNYGDD